MILECTNFKNCKMTLLQLSTIKYWCFYLALHRYNTQSSRFAYYPTDMWCHSDVSFKSHIGQDVAGYAERSFSTAMWMRRTYLWRLCNVSLVRRWNRAIWDVLRYKNADLKILLYVSVQIGFINEHFAFLIQRILELFTRGVCLFLKK